ncbi:MAG TPA: hypothetical protein VJL87_06415 [Bdellovibrionota bacterium]|nr:hypothetical protein [Bdellovibrionota bacterium]
MKKCILVSILTLLSGVAFAGDSTEALYGKCQLKGKTFGKGFVWSITIFTSDGEKSNIGSVLIEPKGSIKGIRSDNVPLEHRLENGKRTLFFEIKLPSHEDGETTYTFTVVESKKDKSNASGKMEMSFGGTDFGEIGSGDCSLDESFLGD